MDMANIASAIFSFVEGIETLQIVLFSLGLLLLIIEMFMPGFGIAGGCGVLLLIAGIIMTARTFFEALVMVVILMLIVALALVFILRSAKYGVLSRKLILRSAAKHEEGFSTTADTTVYVGCEGVAVTVLRPAGIGEFEGRRLDVVTEGAYIEQGTRVKVTRTEGRRIVVEPAEQTAQAAVK